jgi:hypothetical protein
MSDEIVKRLTERLGSPELIRRPPAKDSKLTHWTVCDEDFEDGCVGDLLSVTLHEPSGRWWVELRYPRDLEDREPATSYASLDEAAKRNAQRLHALLQNRMLRDHRATRDLTERYDV